jgi:hypothetical protein
VTMNEREFWLEMRRAALTFARAIEARYGTSRPTHAVDTLLCEGLVPSSEGTAGSTHPVVPVPSPNPGEIVRS